MRELKQMPRKQDAHGRDIVVIGASAGGIAALQRLVRQLPAKLRASLLVVQHISPDGPSLLPQILSRAGALPARFPEDGERPQPGIIYVAPPDRHLILERDTIRLIRGPQENLHRPAIDPLFRSAAAAYGPRVAGIILSGMLDDGAAGLNTVKACGGVTIAQDPDDAAYPDMPRNAIRMTKVDHVLPLDSIAQLIEQLAGQPVASQPSPGKAAAEQKAQIETGFSLLSRELPDMQKLGTPSTFACPMCHGPLWELADGDMLRFRCHVGHAYSSQSLLSAELQDIETALYCALRAVEENAAAARRVARHIACAGPLRSRHADRASDLDQTAAVLRQLIAGQTPLVPVSASHLEDEQEDSRS